MTPGSRFLGGANPPPLLVKLGIRLAMFVTGFVCTFVFLGLSDRNDAAPANNGLKKNDLKNLPKLAYAAANNDSLSDCAICLEEFVDGDELRVLPQCDHGFHVECIDKWLGLHSSCPSCRQNVVVTSCRKRSGGE